MKTVVIYHRADFDGIFCREIAKKFLPEALLVGWDYGDPEEDVANGVNQEDRLYILDLSVPSLMNHPNLVWIDHHKSAIEKYGKRVGYQIDGVAACRLAWQWFSLMAATPNPEEFALPDKQHFFDRQVQEPWAVRLAGEYDIWDKRDTDAELFQHGLRSERLTNETWSSLLDENPHGELVVRLLNQGRALQFARANENSSIIQEIGFTIQWEGLTFLACNAARYNSHLFVAGLNDSHDACFGFKWTGKDWSVSLYHAPGKEQHDLSKIATKYGGGGHRGACGFRTDKLPFLK
jgi:uncharacterized protein